MSLIQWYHPAPQSLLVVAPHQDDEVIGCGGLLAAHSRLGGESTVLYLTCSEQERIEEACAARARLAVTHAVELNLPDGHLRSTEELRQSVGALLMKFKPQTILLPSTGDPHPDHRMAHTIFSEVLSNIDDSDIEILFYETFTPLCNANAWLDITSTAQQKWEALTCYKSQQERYRIVEIARHLNAFRALTTMRRHVHYVEAFRRLTMTAYLQSHKLALMQKGSTTSETLRPLN